jgi:predicted RNase H-like HicB family nuclease
LRNYIAVIRKVANNYELSFPDFPTLSTAVSGLDDAWGIAEEMLATHIEQLRTNDAIPEPSSLEKVIAGDQERKGIAILVTIKAGARGVRKPVRVNVTFPEEVLEQIDRYADDHGLTRSGFLMKAAQSALSGC